MNTIAYGKRSFTLPAHWAEVPTLFAGKRLWRVEMAACLLRRAPEQGALRLLLLYACLPWWGYFIVRGLTGEQVVDLTQWAVAEKVVISTQRIRVGGRTWGLPRLDFANMNMLEWDLAHRALVAAKGTELGMIHFAAHLIRPLRKRAELRALDFAGDERVGFNGFFTEQYAKQLRGLPAGAIAALVEVFCQGHADLVARHPRLFTKKGSGAAPLEIINMVARDGNFGTFEQVCKQPVEVVLLDMGQHLKALEAEAKARKEAEKRGR
jgi:hypothetical protein